MSSKGSLVGQLERCYARRDLPGAWSLMHEMPNPGLHAALLLVMLIAEQDPQRYPAASTRWMARWLAERRPDPDSTRRMMSALEILPWATDREAAERVTLDLAQRQ